MITSLLIIPLIGIGVMLLTPKENQSYVKWIALITSTISFLLSLLLYVLYDSVAASEQGYRFVEKYSWIPQLNIAYYVGVDGLNVFLIILTTFLTLIAVASSWTSVDEQVTAYYSLILFLETAMLGVFVALDLFMFYLFWEASLIPMALLIGRWGGKDRVYAATKFIIYTMAGSAPMLVAALVLYGYIGTSDLTILVANSAVIPYEVQLWLFFAFVLAFAVKIPLFPLHTWLPSAHVQAPTAGSIILAGVLLKLGTYSIMRYAIPLFPQASEFWTPLLISLSVIGVIYGALVAAVQDDVKKLVAYSSVAHMGYVALGIFTYDQIGMSAAVLQMINHGLSTGLLFFLVGVLYEQRHTRLFDDYGGIWIKVPVFGAFFITAAFASVGLPGLNGFVGEFLILMSTFRINPIAAVFATLGLVLAAWYLLTAVRKVLFGQFNTANDGLLDMSPRETAIALALVVPCFFIGIFPNIFFEVINPAVVDLLAESQAYVSR